MRIIIVGSGKLGTNLAEFLTKEGHDIVIIEEDAKSAGRAVALLDCIVVRGNCANIDILREAGADEADLLIACTGNDEMNMICCLLAGKNGTKHTIARIRNIEYADEINSLCIALGIDNAINPEFSTAVEISHILRFPQASGIDTFAGGRVDMVEMRIEKNLANKRIADMNITAGILFGVVERDGRAYIPNGEFVLEEGDSLYIVGESSGISRFFKDIKSVSFKVKDIMIVGGSRIAIYLSAMVARLGIRVKIIEKNPDICVYLNERLEEAVVIEGDGTDEEVLKSEGVGDTDAFIALTNNDEQNLIAAMIAEDCGSSKVIAKISRTNYTRLIHRFGIETIVNPTEIIDNSVLRYVRSMNKEKKTSLKRIYKIANANAEAVEFDASDASKIINKPLLELNIRKGILVAVLVRGRHIIIPRGHDKIHKGDRVIVITKGEPLYSLNDILDD